jgi:hypothetical protein
VVTITRRRIDVDIDTYIECFYVDIDTYIEYFYVDIGLISILILSTVSLFVTLISILISFIGLGGVEREM